VSGCKAYRNHSLTLRDTAHSCEIVLTRAVGSLDSRKRMLKRIEICADWASHRLWPARVPPQRILGKRAHWGRPMMRAFFCIGLSVFLTASLSFAQTSTAPSRAAAQDYSFTIPGTWGWLDTNIELYPGDRVHITGAVIDCAGPTPTEKLDVPLPSAPVGTLLAKLHAETQPCPRHPRRRIRHNRAQPPLSRRERLAMPRKNSCQGARGTPRCRDSQALSGYLCN